ncbi:MAG TPA: amino acid ABC transporter ATP-binding protein [Pirellulales bacterium]|nr:amino acid ABC transporter ATP-binding protein [Pirellulales bacterium]
MPPIVNGAIEVQDLFKRFAAREILRGISLSVARGEVAAIMGPSGGGKSTLLRCLAGLEGFDAGTIDIAGVRLTPQASDGSGKADRNDRPRERIATDRQRRAATLQLRGRVGFVFQQFHLFPHRSVLENVIEGPLTVLGRPRDEASDRGRALLARVGLEHERDQMPDQLSGGQQQRVAIARALAMQPAVLLFDEPTSALDPRTAGDFETVVADLARSGQTMVIVTHSAGFARRTAGTLHVISEGRIVEKGPPAQVLSAPRENATRRLLAGSGED